MTVPRVLQLLCAPLLILFLATPALAQLSPHEKFCVEGESLIQSNNRELLQLIRKLNMTGPQVAKSEFANLARNFRPRYLQQMYSYTSLYSNEQEYYRKLVYVYDNALFDMQNLLNLIGTDATKEEFAKNMIAVAGFGPVLDWTERGNEKSYESLVVEHRKAISGLLEMRRDFNNDIRGKLKLPYDKLNSNNKMRDYFSKNRKMWPPKKSEKTKYPLETLYGLSYLTKDTQAKLKKFDVYAAQLRLVPKQLEYLSKTLGNWHNNNVATKNELAGLKSTSTNSEWELVLDRNFMKALQDAVKTHTIVHDSITSGLTSFANREMRAAYDIVKNKGKVIIDGSSNLYKNFDGSKFNTAEKAFEELRKKMYEFFEAGAI